MKINISTVFQNTCPFGVRDRTTVDGRNPAPVGMVNIPLSIGSYTSQVVQDFFHQQYQVTLSNPVNKKDAKNLKKTIQHSCNKWCFPVSAWDTHRENRWFSDVYFFPSKNTTKTYLKLEKNHNLNKKTVSKFWILLVHGISLDIFTPIFLWVLLLQKFGGASFSSPSSLSASSMLSCSKLGVEAACNPGWTRQNGIPTR